MSQTETKDLEYYMSLNYSVIFNKIQDENGDYFFGKVAELEGCHTDADTLEELMEELDQVKKEYIQIKLEHGDPIPEPNDMPSGKIVLRMPKTLHWRLAGEAALEGVSLNQYMIYKLSQGLETTENKNF